MSDFVNGGWSVFVIAATVLGLLFCLVLLLMMARRKAMADDNTTGHVWDEDLRELNNPLPRWWLWLFMATLAFAALYLALYPGLGNLAGRLGWSSESQYRNEQAVALREAEPVYARLAAMPADALARDPVAMASGERLFANNCATCHGVDARGSKGFPNLTDRDWLWGGTPEKIAETIANGRTGNMPPMAAAVGSSQDVVNLANHVLSLSGSPHNGIAAVMGRDKFRPCAACHGVDGKGNTALGAPNLTDGVWLHGWGEENIVAMITRGKTNVMPAHKDRLTEAQIHLLAAYVWSLSNQPATP